MKRFCWKEGEIAYKVQGEGPQNFLLVHGSGGSHEMMEYTAAHFSKNGRTIIPDLLGHGSSDVPEIEYSLNVFAESLIELCKHEKVDQVVLIGMNYGANIGIVMAQMIPDLISHLILIEPPMFLEPWIVNILEQRIKDLQHPKENWIQETVDSFLLKTSPREREIAIRSLQQTPPFVKASTFKHLLVWDKSHSFSCSIPTFLLQISQPLCTEEKARHVFSNLHIGRVVGSGPWINLEVPLQAHSMIDRFLELQRHCTVPAEV